MTRAHDVIDIAAACVREGRRRGSLLKELDLSNSE
jgi:hypothetical protein